MDQSDTQAADLTQAEWRLGRLELAAGQVIAFANQKVIETRFHALKRAVKTRGLIVVVGVGIFALAPKLAKSPSLAVDRPTGVTVRLRAPERIDAGCKQPEVKAVAIGGTWDAPVIVTQPTVGCPSRKLKLSSPQP